MVAAPINIGPILDSLEGSTWQERLYTLKIVGQKNAQFLNNTG